MMILIQVRQGLCLNEFLGKNKMKKKKIFVGASILSTDFFDIKNTFKKINSSDLDFLHLDVMDGVFVPNISFGPHFIKCLKMRCKKIFDVHLMVKNPLPYIGDFVGAGADIIMVHCEAKNTMKSLRLIKKYNRKCGVVINPDTSYKKIKKFLDIVDYIMVMTVYPGFGGQKFLDNQLEKIQKISSYIQKSGRKILLQVDGGVNFDNAKKLVGLGVDSLVVGSFLFNQKNFSKTVLEFKKI